MALEVHVAGPGLDTTRRLAPGDPALILGRDAECGICLPDPERNVSRRHLSVWNEGEQLQFHVLSVVNGVQTRSGELPPGARGVLATGDMIALAAFCIWVTPVEAAAPPPEFMDTWAQLQHEAERLPPGDTPATVPGVREEDPFGDWGFGSGFGVDRDLRPPAQPGAADLQPFFRGLGLEAPPELAPAELEALGRITRVALQGLLQASQAAAASRQEVRAEDQTVAEQREPNPLRLDTPLARKLRFLFGGEGFGAGFLPPEQALAQLAADLAAHEQAMGPAVQETLKAVLAEFEPETLKKRLLGGGARLFESARAWDAFARDYAERVAAQPVWVRELLDRHFSRAYAKALLRAKRNTPDPGEP